MNERCKGEVEKLGKSAKTPHFTYKIKNFTSFLTLRK
jgi:hypothetical protein